VKHHDSFHKQNSLMVNRSHVSFSEKLSSAHVPTVIYPARNYDCGENWLNLLVSTTSQKIRE